MKRPSDQFLAGSRFTVYQNGDVTVRQTSDGTKNLLHGGGITNDFCRVVARAGNVRRHSLTTLGLGARHDRDHFLNIKWFG